MSVLVAGLIVGGSELGLMLLVALWLGVPRELVGRFSSLASEAVSLVNLLVATLCYLIGLPETAYAFGIAWLMMLVALIGRLVVLAYRRRHCAGANPS